MFGLESGSLQGVNRFFSFSFMHILISPFLTLSGLFLSSSFCVFNSSFMVSAATYVVLDIAFSVSVIAICRQQHKQDSSTWEFV